MLRVDGDLLGLLDGLPERMGRLLCVRCVGNGLLAERKMTTFLVPGGQDFLGPMAGEEGQLGALGMAARRWRRGLKTRREA
jgi:hypothetical protein